MWKRTVERMFGACGVVQAPAFCWGSATRMLPDIDLARASRENEAIPGMSAQPPWRCGSAASITSDMRRFPSAAFATESDGESAADIVEGVAVH